MAPAQGWHTNSESVPYFFNKGKHKQWDYIKLKSFYMDKETIHEKGTDCEKGADFMGEHICQWYFEQGFNFQHI